VPKADRAAHGLLTALSATWTCGWALPLFGQPMDAQRRTLLSNRQFRRGFAQLEPLGLSFDAWCFHTQINDVVDLARAFPDTRIIVDHLASPLGVGPYATRRTEVSADWRQSISRLRPPADSAALAIEWRPYIEYAIERFGVGRCMFESNFPVDADTCDYRTLWNAFKRITANASADDKAALYHDTALRAYRLSNVEQLP
jgi:L-fuconolactonase